MIWSALLAIAAATEARPNYATWLRTDATEFRDMVAKSHPGPVNVRDAGFNTRLAAAYTRALRRARTTRTYPQYSWALEELTAAFDDGHLGIMADPAADASYPWAFSWPGFMTELTGDSHRVTVSEENGVRTGAVLVGCDGTNADSLAADRIGRFVGRWSLNSRRRSQAATLFLPPDNPWLAGLRRCTFEQGGVSRTVILHWRPISATKRKELLAHSRERFHAQVSLDRLADGTAWISLGSFDSDAASASGQALDALTQRLNLKVADLRAASRIVFDLRGNNGGSSAWLNRIAETLWGKPYLDSKRPKGGYAEWRVSPENVAQIRTYQSSAVARRKVDPSLYNWTVRTLSGLEQAQRAGQPLWAEPHGTPMKRAAVGDLHNPVAGKVFVLTDFGCASACLDAVDLLTALGAVQVGQETNADSNYMEIREHKVEDGAVAWVPMKVYRDRPRGSNVPAVPRHSWEGSMSDTSGLQRWIGSL